MRTATSTIERRIEMFRKLPIFVPVAILLGAASAVPAAAQTGSHHPGRFPNHARAYSAYAFAPSAAQSSIGCPPLEGYPDCHPNGRAPWTIYSNN
jgi:hypothetical protein